MPQNIDYNDELHTGQHQFEKAPIVPAGSFGDTQIGTTNPIDATKLKHQYIDKIAQAAGSAAANERRVVHIARSAGSVTAIEAGITTAAVGDSTVTIDLKKNGSSILTSVITINSTHAAYAKVSGAIASGTYAVGDVFEIVAVTTVGTGTLPQGLFSDAVFREGSG